VHKGKELNDFQRNLLDISISTFVRAAISDCRSEIKFADAIVDKDDSKLSQRRAMTLDIELEQRFQSVDQVDRRAHDSWWNLSNEWRLRKIEARKQVAEEEAIF
jgi:hypothetical protein